MIKEHLTAIICGEINPKDADILRNIYNHQTASDRFDIVTRVFRMKMNELIRDIKENAVTFWCMYHASVNKKNSLNTPLN